MIGPKTGHKNCNRAFMLPGKKYEKKYKPQDMKVAVIGANQIFGHEDVLFERNYTTTAKCISTEATFYVCKAEQFRNLIKKDEKAFDILANICEVKNIHLKHNIAKAAKKILKSDAPPVELDMMVS